jgi:hypothetical protein
VARHTAVLLLLQRLVPENLCGCGDTLLNSFTLEEAHHIPRCCTAAAVLLLLLLLLLRQWLAPENLCGCGDMLLNSFTLKEAHHIPRCCTAAAAAVASAREASWLRCDPA